jgi:hypothetical protein
MAVWVNLNRAAKFPEVEKVYKRAGWGQGTGQGSDGAAVPASARKGFLTYVKYLVQGAANGTIARPAWIRLSPNASNDWQDVQVDVTAIPGVRVLGANGKWNNPANYND